MAVPITRAPTNAGHWLVSADRVLVATDGMLFLSAEDAGIEAGIAALQEIAGLDSISRVSPVTLRLVFDAQ